MHLLAASSDDALSVWERLPSGPLRGVSTSVWKTLKGSTLHGARSCRTLDRSSPVPVAVHLGDAGLLGDLSWPTRLHCALDLPGELGQYLRFTRSAARDISMAQTAEAAAAAYGERQVGERAASPRPWQSFAPFLLACLLNDEPVAARHPSAEPGSARAWSTVHDEVVRATSRARDAAGDLHELLSGDAYETRDVRADNLASVGAAVAAVTVLGHYDARVPGPLRVAYRDAGADAATEVALALRPNAQAHRGGLARSLRWDGPDKLVQRHPEAVDADVLDPLDDALYAHGMQSWTYHRAHERVWTPERTWKAALSGWLKGETVGFPADMHGRLRLTRPPVFEVAYPALAAAEAGWLAFLRGAAAASRRDIAVTVAVAGLVDGFTRWHAASAVLASPFQTYERDGHKRLVTALTELELASLPPRDTVDVTSAVAARPIDRHDVVLRRHLHHAQPARAGRQDATMLAEAVASLPTV